VTPLEEKDVAVALRNSELEGEIAAHERTLDTVRRAYAERPLTSGRRPWLAGLITAIALIAAAIVGLTPAGAEFRQWVTDTIDPQSTNPRPALTRLPGGGRLVAQSRAGTSVVESDGSSRFLGNFSAASLSPHGLYLGTAAGRTLAAIEPSGDLHWSLPAAHHVRFPVWSQRLGFRIAYLSGNELRVVAGDGTNDGLLSLASPVAPAWRGRSDRVLAFVDQAGTIRVVDVDRAQTLRQFEAPEKVRGLAWSRDGSRLLAFSADQVRVTNARGALITRFHVQPGSRIEAAGFLGTSDEIALVQARDSGVSVSSSVSILGAAEGVGRPRLIFRTPGRLTGLTSSPDGGWVVVGWRDAGQWLFLEPSPGGAVHAVENVAQQLAPRSQRPPFPAPTAWCCPG
jgi:WD40 repeat protein